MTLLPVLDSDGPPSKHPIRNIESVLVHGFAQVSTQAIRKCAEYEIGVHWLTVTGAHVGSLVATAGPVQRRVRQYQALTDEPTCLRLAKALVAAKVEGQYRYLLRATRGDDPTRQLLQADLDAIHQELRSVGRAADRDAVRGHEGAAAKAYFRGLRNVLAEGVPDELRFDGRNRRPPLDRFNALLSFGYGVLYTTVTDSTACRASPRLTPCSARAFSASSASAPSVCSIAFRITRTNPSRRSSRFFTRNSTCRRISPSASPTFAVCFRANSITSTASQTM
jgi:CRISPR-associated endonuclease Cas1